MVDLISRQDAIEAVNNAFDRETLLTGFVRSIAVRAIMGVPLAELGTDLAEVGTDCVSRQAAVDTLNRQAEAMQEWSERYAEQRKGVLSAVNLIEDLPSAEPVQKHGRWIINDDDTAGEGFYICSNCGHDTYDVFDFCPKCGARMVNEDDS